MEKKLTSYARQTQNVIRIGLDLDYYYPTGNTPQSYRTHIGNMHLSSHLASRTASTNRYPWLKITALITRVSMFSATRIFRPYCFTGIRMFLDGCQISIRLYTRVGIGRSWIVGPGRGPNEGKGFDLAIHVSQGGLLLVVLYLLVYPATSLVLEEQREVDV
jgi:hypothetical protein